MIPMAIPAFSKTLKATKREASRRQETAEGVAGQLGAAQQPPRQDAEEREHAGRSHEAELFAQGGEDEVGLLLGDVGQVGLRAVEQPRTPRPARADGGHRLAHVVPGALEVLADVEHRRDAVQLVVLQELEVDDGEGAGDGEQDQQQQVAVGDPGDDEHHEEHHGHHDAAAEVGLLHHEQDRHRRPAPGP